MTKNIMLNAGGGKSRALGARIRAARKSTGLNQAEFGKKLGVSQPAISNWESGREKPNPSVISKLAEMTNSHDIVAQFLDASGIRNVQVAECKSPSTSETRANEVKEIFQLRDPSAAGTSRVLNLKEVETVLRLPSTWFPAQSQIYAIEIEDDSMAPVISKGSLVFVDTSRGNRESLVGKFVAVRLFEKVAIRLLQKSRQSFFISHSSTDTKLARTLVRNFKETVIGEVVMWMSRPQPGPIALVALYRNEIEEMVDALVANKRGHTKQNLGKTISELVESKRVDPTLGRLIMTTVEISNKAAHGMEITREDFEQVCHFMPIVRSSLRERPV